MASTYKPADALEFGNAYIKHMRVHPVSARVLDDSARYMWMAAPWRWTIGVLDPVTLASSTQDYTVTPPSDFLYLLDGYMSDTNNPARGIRAESVIPSANYINGVPSIYAVTSTTLRVWPTPGNLSVASYILPYYKKQCPKVTNQTAYTAGFQVFDDEWFHVYQDIVLYHLYKFADDQRAGSATYNSNGQIQYSGQRAAAEAGIAMMRQKEKLPAPEQFMRTVGDQPLNG